MNQDSLFNYLVEFSDTIEQFVKNGISSNEFKPVEQEFIRTIFSDEFKYGDNGIENQRWETHRYFRATWDMAAHKATWSFKETHEFQEALEKFSLSYCKNDSRSNELFSFVGKIVRNSFNIPEETKQLNNYAIVSRFLDDLSGKPAKYCAEVMLHGLVIKPIEIKITDGIMIRQPSKTDIEKETSFSLFPITEIRTPFPTAIGIIELEGRFPYEIQARVRKLIVMLNLFRVGSVAFSTCKPKTNSIIGLIGGTWGSGIQIRTLERCVLRKEDETKINVFWNSLDPVLPEMFYHPDNSKDNYLTFAYERYHEILFLADSYERGIANAVIALEALLLNTQSEISFKLQLFTAKAISFFNEDSLKVRDAIKLAYDIRSQFTHGNHINTNTLKKVNEKYGGLKQFLLIIAEYLRKILVSMMLIQMEKQQFITLITDSMIDKNKESDLIRTFSLPKSVLLS